MVARDADVDQGPVSIESGVLDQSRTVKVLTFVRFTSSRAEEFHTEINTKVFKLFQRWWSLWKEQEVSAQCVCVFEDTTVCVCVCVCVLIGELMSCPRLCAVHCGPAQTSSHLSAACHTENVTTWRTGLQLRPKQSYDTSQKKVLLVKYKCSVLS